MLSNLTTPVNVGDGVNSYSQPSSPSPQPRATVVHNSFSLQGTPIILRSEHSPEPHQRIHSFLTFCTPDLNILCLEFSLRTVAPKRTTTMRRSNVSPLETPDHVG